MSMPHATWANFFFHTIIKLRGEGTLSILFSSGGALHDMSWCQDWIHGSPKLTTEIQNDLAQAERALADALQEEDKKAREIRVCPNCGNHFIVDAVNCGAFVCGQDAHGGIAGAQIAGGLGCGRQFNINDAPRYIIDEKRLATLRTNLTNAQTDVQKCEAGADLWESAKKDLCIPFYRFQIERGTAGQSIFPIAVVGDHHHHDPAYATVESFLRRLQQGSDFLPRQNALPDFIEVR